MVSKTPNRELVPFFRRLGTDFDSFARRGTSLIWRPIDQFLFGFSFYPKEGDPRCRWVQPFGFPLYVPRDWVPLSYGERIPQDPLSGLKYLWVYVYDSHVEPELDAETIMRAIGMPMLDRFRSVEAFQLFLENYPGSKRDSYYYLDKAATDAYVGDFNQCLRSVSLLREHLEYWRQKLGDDLLRDYEYAQLDAAAKLEVIATNGDGKAMERQLHQWRQENLDRLKIRDIASTL